MSLLARAKIQTNLCLIPGDISSSIKKLNIGEEIRIDTKRKKVGNKVIYITLDGYYVNASDVLITRDNDYFFHNFKTKNLMRNTQGTDNRVYGINAVIGHERELTSMWRDPKTAEGGDDNSDGETVAVLGTEVGSYKSNDPSTSFVDEDDVGGVSTNTVLISEWGQRSRIASTSVGRIINKDIMGTGLTVGKLIDASANQDTFNNLISTTASRILSSWISRALKYVVGFADSSGLSDIFALFGLDFRSLLSSGLYNLLGGGLGNSFWNSIINNLGLNGSYSIFHKRKGYYSNLEEQMEAYFRYKGCNGLMIIKTFANLRWKQDAYYSTEYLTPQKDTTNTNPAIKIYRDLHNSLDFPEFQDAFSTLKTEFNLNIDRRTIATAFNRFRVPTLDNKLSGSRGYVYFTRPDLQLNMQEARNLGGSASSISGMAGSIVNDGITSARISTMAANLLKSHSVLMGYLMGDKGEGNHSFIPIFTHCCTGIDIPDEVLETMEYGETFTGWKFIYGMSMNKSKTAGTVSVNFEDDNKLSIYKMIKMWCEYIDAVWRGEAAPKSEYIRLHVIDYAISIHYFLTDNTGENIIFWSKYTGCFPTSVPSSTFSDKLGDMISNPSYNISFAYSRKDDCNPIHLAEFNHLSGDGFTVAPIYNKETLRVARSFVGAPFVDTEDGGYTFKLRHRPN